MSVTKFITSDCAHKRESKNTKQEWNTITNRGYFIVLATIRRLFHVQWSYQWDIMEMTSRYTRMMLIIQSLRFNPNIRFCAGMPSKVPWLHSVMCYVFSVRQPNRAPNCRILPNDWIVSFLFIKSNSTELRIDAAKPYFIPMIFRYPVEEDFTIMNMGSTGWIPLNCILME